MLVDLREFKMGRPSEESMAFRKSQVLPLYNSFVQAFAYCLPVGAPAASDPVQKEGETFMTANFNTFEEAEAYLVKLSQKKRKIEEFDWKAVVKKGLNFETDAKDSPNVESLDDFEKIDDDFFHFSVSMEPTEPSKSILKCSAQKMANDKWLVCPRRDSPIPDAVLSRAAEALREYLKEEMEEILEEEEDGGEEMLEKECYPLHQLFGADENDEVRNWDFGFVMALEVGDFGIWAFSNADGTKGSAYMFN
jgi:hypothetical protein